MKPARVLSIFVAIAMMAAMPIKAYGAKENEELKNTLFSNIKGKIEEARGMKADLLSPESFAQGEKAYAQALDAFNAGKNLDTIKGRIETAENLIKKAVDNVELSKLTLGKLIAAREDAINASAPQYALEYFKEGETKFMMAARQVETGNVTKARKLADEAEPLFKKAQARAIKEGLLGGVKREEKKAEEKTVRENSPKTLKDAERKLREAEKYVDSQGYDIETAKKRVEEARYDYEHSMQIAEKVAKAKKERLSLEDIYLENEKRLEEISLALEIPLSFDKGMDYQAEQIAAAVERNAKDREDLTQRLAKVTSEYESKTAEMNQQITDKDKEIATLKGKSISEAENLNILKQKFEKKNLAEERYENVRKLFTANDGQVMKDGSDIRLQLYGITFDPGKSVIGVSNYDLLAKVQKSIREFPQARVVVEGHTDSVGDKKQNEILSEERAKAVMKYLIANSSVAESAVSAVGFGDSKPVASNKIPAERKKNRRIDIIIKTE